MGVGLLCRLVKYSRYGIAPRFLMISTTGGLEKANSCTIKFQGIEPVNPTISSLLAFTITLACFAVLEKYHYERGCQ
jgi:hypothetical protein